MNRQPEIFAARANSPCAVAQAFVPVGQTIGFCRLLFRACGPRNFMKNWSSPRGGGFRAFWAATYFQWLTLVFRPCLARADHQKRWSAPRSCEAALCYNAERVAVACVVAT